MSKDVWDYQVEREAPRRYFAIAQTMMLAIGPFTTRKEAIKQAKAFDKKVRANDAYRQEIFSNL